MALRLSGLRVTGMSFRRRPDKAKAAIRQSARFRQLPDGAALIRPTGDRAELSRRPDKAPAAIRQCARFQQMPDSAALISPTGTGLSFLVGRIRRKPPSGNQHGSGNKKTGQFPDPFFVSLRLTLNKLQRNPVQTAGKDNRRRQREDPGHQNVGHGFTLQTAAVDNHRTGYGRREHVGG